MSWNSKTWAWVKKYFSVNPLSTDGMPVVGKFRTPAAGSRPEKYAYPKTEASKISGNYYFQRDTRRNYPRLAVYTQEKVAGLIDGGFITPGQIAAPAQVSNPKPLVEVLNTHKLYSSEKQAPVPAWGRKMVWKESEDFVYPNNGTYFPMKVYTT
ncbi:hypothetical protein BDF14DRAFT_1876939 [Spinellus fusiger]|nr:hypothetical protein BDF14DRAFT_1876939 [Spinellus fusiger]